jgi:hypothetical protein
MDTTTVRMLEGKLKRALASVDFWYMQHNLHCDTSSSRLYREALLRASTTADILADLHIEGADTALTTLIELTSNIAPVKEQL